MKVQPPAPRNELSATGITAERAPSLSQLLATVSDALDEAKVSHWLLPGLGLLPPTLPTSDGRLNPWQEGIDLGVYQNDQMRVLLAQSSLQAVGIVAVESYFGIRLFHISGLGDDRYDFRVPFVDILLLKEEEEHVLSYCCDCAPVTISACTKKTCGCLVCAATIDEMFPLRHVRIEGVRRSISGPRDMTSLMLPRDLVGVHPGVFNV